MVNSFMVDFILSLVFVYFLFSMLTSGIQEIFVFGKNSRGALLKTAIKKVLDDPKNKNFGDLFFLLPTIDGLSMPDNRRPSYIEPKNFAKSVFQLLQNEAKVDHYTQDEKTKKMILNKIEQGEKGVEQFVKGVENLKESDLKDLLKNFTIGLQGVQDEVQKTNTILQNIEDWYTGYMDRVTGWYKREVRNSLLWKSLIIAFILNINFFAILKTLYTNTQLRDTLVSQATNISQSKSSISPDSSKAIINEFYDMGLPIGWNMSGLSAIDNSQFSFKNLLNNIKAELSQKGNMLYSLIGIIISAIIMSFGAPFWFDIMKKIVNMRNTGLNSKILKQ